MLRLFGEEAERKEGNSFGATVNAKTCIISPPFADEAAVSQGR